MVPSTSYISSHKSAKRPFLQASACIIMKLRVVAAPLPTSGEHGRIMQLPMSERYFFPKSGLLQ
jgi:hypothetical protein